VSIKYIKKTFSAFFTFFHTFEYFDLLFPLDQVEIIHCLDLQMNITCYKFENWLDQIVYLQLFIINAKLNWALH